MIDTQTFIKQLKNYDFLENSVEQFSRETGIMNKTIKKYLRELNIPHKTKNFLLLPERNPNGTFKSKTIIYKEKKIKEKKKEKDYSSMLLKYNNKL